MRIIFLGTPQIALTSLERLNNSNHEVIAVVCQPDKPSNRNKIVFSPVKQYALARNLPLYQFEKISKNVDVLRELNPDIMITVAYGQMLSSEVLAVAKYGVINAHGSILPKYRGASPIQSSIINGEQFAGITIMKTVLKMDAGDIIMQRKIPILPTDNAQTLTDKLGEVAADLLIEVLPLIDSGKAIYTPQEQESASYCVKLTKQNALIDFSKSSEQIVNHIRGYNPNPIAYTLVNGQIIKIYQATKIDFETNDEPCGTVLTSNAKKGLIIKTGDGAIQLDEIQREGAKRMTAKAYLLGNTIETGIVLPQQ